MKPSKLLALILALVCQVTFCDAEDWITNDGKTYQVISVVKHDIGSVTILDKNGNYTAYETVPLASLPPDLQKRFHYDAKAEASLKAKQDAEATTTRTEARQRHEQDTLYTKAKADFDSKEKATVRGQAFIATKDGQITQLGFIHVYVFSEDQAGAAMEALSTKAFTATQNLQPTLDEEKAKCTKLKEAIDTYEGDPESDEFKVLAQVFTDSLKTYKTTLAKYYHYYSPAYYSSALPTPLATAETDANGNFSIQIPKTGSWVVGACEQGKAVEQPGNDFWLSKVGQREMDRNEVLLSNRNSSSSDSHHSLVKTMDQSAIDEIVATGGYLLKGDSKKSPLSETLSSSRR